MLHLPGWSAFSALEKSQRLLIASGSGAADAFFLSTVLWEGWVCELWGKGALGQWCVSSGVDDIRIRRVAAASGFRSASSSTEGLLICAACAVASAAAALDCIILTRVAQQAPFHTALLTRCTPAAIAASFAAPFAAPCSDPCPPLRWSVRVLGGDCGTSLRDACGVLLWQQEAVPSAPPDVAAAIFLRLCSRRVRSGGNDRCGRWNRVLLRRACCCFSRLTAFADEGSWRDGPNWLCR